MLSKTVLFGIIACFMIIPTADSDPRGLRKKRYIVFPEGSSFSIALCMTVHTLTPDNIFTEGLNWGISYDLPNESKPELEPFLKLRKDKIRERPNKYIDKSNFINENYDADYHYTQRRHRRDLYNKLEVIINAMGFDGRSCILRALCEAGQRFMPKGNTLVEEMMRIVFAMPLRRVFSFEPEEHRTYTEAHKAGHEGRNCLAIFPGCSFSLIDMALGKYNAGLPPDLRYTMK